MKSSLYDFYKNYYDLENLNIYVSNNDILFLIYDDKSYYFLNDSKFLDFNNQKKLLNLIKSVSKDYKMDIINYYPVCFCMSTLVIAVRILNTNSIKLKRYSISEVPMIYKKLICYHKNNFGMAYLSSSISKEIIMSKKYGNRYKIHNKIIKKYILTHKKRKKEEFKKILTDLIPEKESIIDVSCGDNKDIFDISIKKKYNLIVGNDICLKYLGGRINDNIVYTNDDTNFNIIKENSYDVVFCKNTLHHMNDVNAINNILSFLNRVSKEEILIIEICNPKETGGLPKILNKWLYANFLKDVGNCFLNESQFKKVIEDNFTNHKIEYSNFTNILGTYMIAKIGKDK